MKHRFESAIALERGINPLIATPLITNPLITNPLITNPLITSPLGTTPQSSRAPSHARWQAELSANQVLLNCYCREMAGPRGQYSIGPLFGQHDWPMSIRQQLHANQHAQVMHILLPEHAARLLVVVAGLSCTGNFRYLSPVFHKAPNQPWRLLEGEALASLLLAEMAEQMTQHPMQQAMHQAAQTIPQAALPDRPDYSELLAQIRESRQVTALLLSEQHDRPARAVGTPIEQWLASEQALLYGHPFHPAPKSRAGFSASDLALYSPELGARFQLHYFAVHPGCVTQHSQLDTSCAELLAAALPNWSNQSHVPVPVHPWQARWLLSLPLVQQALEQGWLRYLGPQGGEAAATSSIRTLYLDGQRFSYKCSLHVRITNCVRKNAWYELEGALQVSRILAALRPTLQQHFPGWVVLDEPAYLSVNLAAANGLRSGRHNKDDLTDSADSADIGDVTDDAVRQIMEGFGLILRENPDRALWPGCSPLLAASLFGNREAGLARLSQIFADIEPEPNHFATRENWFARYVALLLPPVLYCYFEHGIIFEPHLQNVLIGLQNGWPAQVFLRDFEGVKLVQSQYPASALPEVPARVRSALWYDWQQGWNRIAYCLLVNHFSEAIQVLADCVPEHEARLWGVVRQTLMQYLASWGSPAAEQRINALLAGAALPGKTNLLNRFLQRPDRAAEYVPVANPMVAPANSQQEVVWN